jgi:tetratricopeptide (TPR) repeat protein
MTPGSKRFFACFLSAASIALLVSSSAFAQDAALQHARRLFANGSYDQASRILEVSVSKQPDNSDAHLLLAQIYTLEDRRTDAIHEFTRTIELVPQSAVAYDALGTALNRFAEFEQARKAFEQSIAIDPSVAQPHINLAMSLAQANEMSAAAEQLQAAIRLAPREPSAATAHYLLAKVYADSDPTRALDELNSAVKIDAHNVEAWLALGELRRSINDEAGTIEAFTSAVAANPQDADAQYQLGSEYLAQGKNGMALQHLKLARKLMPHPTLALLYGLDRALRADGQTTEAAQVRTEAKAMIAKDARENQQFVESQLRENEGVDLEKQGLTEKAVEKYRAALELNPSQEGFRLNYALALCRLNRWQQGIGELKEILENDSGNIEARHALFIAEDKARQSR